MTLLFLDFDIVLRNFFSSESAHRGEVVKPDVPDAEVCQRQTEIYDYLNRNSPRLLAIDKYAELFKLGESLIHVGPARGFNEDCASRLNV
jgi:hypothetical protein